MLIEVSSPLTIKLPSGEVDLVPGQPVELPDEQARRLLKKAPGRARVISHMIQAGSLISWTRADGSAPTGVVDLIHVDDRGTRWAVVIIGESWAVVNLKFAKLEAS